mmetsp:Transcript_17488/g.31577  ORF Transcript_17488/g.31577 Transcript_17488/m.31577 type:complete len:473 (+) Transcript_17488:89-1507(+)
MGKKSRWHRKHEDASEEDALQESAGIKAAKLEGHQAFDHRVADECFAELMRIASQARTVPATASVQEACSGATATRFRPASQGEVHFPMMTASEMEKYMVPVTASPEKLREVYEEHGVVVVTDVLTAEECRLLESLLVQDLLQLVEKSAPLDPLARERLQSLTDVGLSAWPAWWSKELGFKGMASQRGMPQGWFAWAARLHPHVKQVFASLYGVPQEELAVGLDVPFFSASDTEPATANPEWLHVDQNHRTGLTWECAQGVLYIWPCSERTSCTVAWPDSHKLEYEKMMTDSCAAERGRMPGGQSVHVSRLHNPQMREELLAKGVQQGAAKRIPCPAGSLLLWDSRVIHQGWAGGPRCAQPVCWEPKARRKPAALHQKRYVCGTGIATSHSAAEGRVHGMIKSRNAPSAFEEGRPIFKPCITPYAVLPEREAEWNAMQDELWGPANDPRKRINRFDSSALSEVLRAEVEAAL